MVNFISSWAEQIVLSVIIATILEMILPSGKSKKYIKTVIGIYILFCIISPFINTNQVISSTKLNLEDYVSTDIKSEEIDQTSMNKRLQELYLEELEKDVTKTVENLGYGVKKCEVEAELFDEANVGIKKIELYIEKKTGNISQIKEVEINVGQSSNSSQSNTDSEDINALKNNIAEHYKISKDIININ